MGKELLSRKQWNNWMKDANEKKKLQILFINQCAPLLQRIKPAVYLRIVSNQREQWEELVRSNGLQSFCFYEEANRDCMLFYDESLLNQYLLQEDIRQFFIQNGYVQLELTQLLQQLKQSIIHFYERKQTFPHEIGILLGYPVCDVLGFQKDQGKTSICCGYWNVYQNKEQMLQLFLSYDQARAELLNKFMEKTQGDY